MSKKNRKQHIGHNKKDSNTREYKRKLSSLQELAGTIIDKEAPKEPEPTSEATFDPNKFINGVIKEHNAGNG